jgi:hypothetical protein
MSTFVFIVSGMVSAVAYAILDASVPQAFAVAASAALVIGLIGMVVQFEDISDLKPVHVAATSFACAGAAFMPFYLNYNLPFVLACLAIVGWVEWRNGRPFFGSALAATPIIGTLFGIGLWVVDRHNSRVDRWYRPPV